MDSWWDLGEGSGYSGDTLALHRFTCPFCEVQGTFERVARFVKENPRTGKRLNFDTYKCVNCVGYVMVLWSANERSFGGMHNYVVMPWPKRLTKHPEHCPRRSADTGCRRTVRLRMKTGTLQLKWHAVRCKRRCATGVPKANGSEMR